MNAFSFTLSVTAVSLLTCSADAVLFKNVLTGQCLTMASSGYTRTVTMRPCDGSLPQEWVSIPVEGAPGYRVVQSQLHPNNPHCLDNGHFDDAFVYAHGCNHGDFQKWTEGQVLENPTRANCLEGNETNAKARHSLCLPESQGQQWIQVIQPVTTTMPPTTTTHPEQCSLYPTYDITYREHLAWVSSGSVGDCCDRCERNPECLAFSYVASWKYCFLKNSTNLVPVTYESTVGILRTSATKPTTTTSPEQCSIYPNYDITYGEHLTRVRSNSVGDCCNRCDQNPECLAFSYVESWKYCFFKNSTNLVPVTYESTAGLLRASPTTTIKPTTTRPSTTTQNPTSYCQHQPDGIYPHPLDCAMFIKCSNGFTHFFTCPAPLLFNPETEACDFPDQVVCGQYLNQFIE